MTAKPSAPGGEPFDALLRDIARIEPREPPTADRRVEAVAGEQPERETVLAGRYRLVAGLAAPGAGEVAAQDTFELIADPGAHIIRASRPGHADIVLNPSYAPGVHEALNLELETLPAHLHVESTIPSAVVLLDGRDVGIAPVTLSRPAGIYRVEVQKRDQGPLLHDRDPGCRRARES